VRARSRGRPCGVPAERETLWPQVVRIFPLYEEYAKNTDRQIPVVLLTPQD